MSLDSEAIQAYGALLAQALIPLVLGSFKSLKTPQSTKAKRKARSVSSITPNTDVEEEEEDSAIDETLTWADTLIFPVLGSVALLSLWLVIKYVGKEWLNTVLGVYFTGAGMFALQDTLGSILSTLGRFVGYKPETYHIRVSSGFKQVYHAKTSLLSLALLPFSIAIPLFYIYLDRPYLLSNLIALCLATSTVAILKLDSFLTAGVLLSLLLVYDIFWVFATPVMVTVATSLEAPIKILAPRTSPSGINYALLGLGDIVIPGLLISLCLRFDLHRHTLRHPEAEVTPRSSFGKGYWVVGVVSYVLGLAGCMGVMAWWGRAQPALLYLSPACILGPLLFALIRGEFNLFWEYNDSPESDQTPADDTIEAPSEAAIRAKQGAKAAVNGGSGNDETSPALADGVETAGEAEVKPATMPSLEDDSWMETEGTGTNTPGGAVRKRKGKKK